MSNVTYLNTYIFTPNVGIGLNFLRSTYPSTIALTELMIDVNLINKFATYSTIQINRTAGSVSQIALSYIACDSSFWLDIVHSYVDLSGQTVFTSGSAS